MTITMKYWRMCAFVLAGTFIMACSREDQPEIQPGIPSDNVVTLTTTISRDDENPTRALTENGVKTFQAGEEIAVVYDKTDNTNARVVATLTASDISNNGKSARITVTMTNPKTGGAVKYVYPASMALGEYVEQGFENTDAIFYEQNGTLSGIETYVDYAKFEGTFNGTELPSGTLRNQLAICKFTIKDGEGNDITSQVTKLTIKNGQNVYYINTTQQEKIWVALKPITSGNINIYAAETWKLYKKTVTSNTTLAANTLTPITVTAPVVQGALSGLFSVNDSHELVYFSQGNLQATYNKSSSVWDTWKFADYQHAFVGKDFIHIYDPGEGEKIDLFGRSSWTHAAGSNNYGIDESGDDIDYAGDFLDWGTLNIQNGGGENKWRTLSKSELNYLLNFRLSGTAVAGVLAARYMRVQLGAAQDNIKGIVLFPDHYILPTLEHSTINESDINQENTPGVILHWEDWGKMEAAGAVLLPCAGYREGESVRLKSNDYPAGVYWTSTDGGGHVLHYLGIRFDMSKYDNGYYPLEFVANSRSSGYSVRLIGPGSANH